MLWPTAPPTSLSLPAPKRMRARTRISMSSVGPSVGMNHPFFGSMPSGSACGIRTRDLRLERLGAVPRRGLRHRLALATPGVPSSMAVQRGIPGPAQPIAARVFVPDSVSAVYLHIHGGGFAQGEALACDARNEATARSC